MSSEGGIGVDLKGSLWLLGGALRRASRVRVLEQWLLNTPDKTLLAARVVRSRGFWMCLAVGQADF